MQRLLFALLALGLGATLWFSLFSEAGPTLDAARNPQPVSQRTPKSGSTASSPSALPAPPPSVEAPPQETRRGRATPDAEGETALLSVRVLDGGSGAPIADLPVMAYGERTQKRIFGRGATDRDGCVAFRVPGEDVYVIQTARRPPHAPTRSAAWVTSGSGGHAELHVGPGGSLVGRVVEATGAPAADMPVSVFLTDWAKPALERHADTAIDVARTDADGRFEVLHVQSQPEGLWIVEGEVRPERWRSLRLTVRDEAWGVQRSVRAGGHVKPGERVDLGELVLATVEEYRGRVVDASGSPVEGALVSGNWNRATRAMGLRRSSKEEPLLGPGDEGFVPAAGDCVTDTDGRFHLRALPNWPAFAVETRDGVREAFHHRDVLEPGQHEGIELALSARALLVLDVRDEGGARVLATGAEDEGRPPRMNVRLFGPGFEGDAWQWVGADPDGLARAALEGDPADLERIQVLVPGFLPALLDLERGAPREVLRVVLERRPALAFALERESPEDPGWDHVRRIRLRACLAAPEGRAQNGCCGLGGQVSLALADGGMTAEIAVATRGEYWVEVRADPGGEALVLGPLVPDSGRVTEVALRPPPRPAGDDDGVGEPSPPSETLALGPPEDEPRGGARVRLVDGRTGEAVEGGSVTFVPSGPGERYSPSQEIDRQGVAHAKRLAPGAWTFVAHVPGFEALSGAPFSVVVDGTVDLGSFELTPAPVRRARVLEADGTPAQGVQWRSGMIAGAIDGRLEVYGEDAGRDPIEVNAPQRDGRRIAGMQLVWIDDWPLDVEVEVRLAAWRDVEIRIHGIEPAHREGRLEATWSSERGWVDRHRGSRTESLAAVPGAWEDGPVYRLRLAPGRYPLEFGSALYEAPGTELEVLDGEGVLVVDVWMERR